jgi:hypothetical protein
VRDGYVGIQTTRVSSESSRTLGGVLALGGGALAYVGLLVLSVSANDSHYDDNGLERHEESDDGQVTGAVMMLSGIGAGVAGLVMLTRTKTTVDVTELRTKKRAASLERPRLSIPLGSGFALTERGVTF